jgi:hypothetical protein
MNLGALTLKGRRKFTVVVQLRFAGGTASAASDDAEARGAERVREKEGGASKKW